MIVRTFLFSLLLIAAASSQASLDLASWDELLGAAVVDVVVDGKLVDALA